MSKNNKKYNRQSAVSLFLAVIIMGVLLAVVLGLTPIFISQLRMMGEMGYSVIALTAADAGIEEVSMNRLNPSSTCIESSPCSLGEAQYFLDIKRGGEEEGDCPSVQGEKTIHYCIKSIGIYRGVRRGIEIIY